ncbi:MAG: ATP-binding protein, partial [Aquimonas sp.]|nr:ATP-binding protein [Aquimonas sp.]
FASLPNAAQWHVELPALALSLRVRPRWLQRALRNLIDNAERYGKAPLHCVVEQQGDTCVMEIRDHGAGVSEQIIDRLREPFFRGDASRSTPGSGLGLAIVARAAALHGGELLVENAHPGLRVRLILPAAILLDQ